MFAYVMNDTNNEKICLIFIPGIVSTPEGAEMNLVLDGKKFAFKVIEYTEKDIGILKSIDKVSEYYGPDKVYEAFIATIHNWESLKLLLS